MLYLGILSLRPGTELHLGLFDELQVHWLRARCGNRIGYAFARYYNPRIGRFMSGDPLGGDISDPQSLNRYSYVRGNPANLTDPTGLLPAIDSFGWMDWFVLPDRSGRPNRFGDSALSWALAPSAYFNGGNQFCDSFAGTVTCPWTNGEHSWVTTTQSDNSKPWEFRSNVVALLRGKNDCSAWFNKGTGSAADIMSQVPILLYTPKDKYVSYDMPDANTSANPQTPIYVNSLGRFYTARYNFSRVGGYAAGSLGARMTILLHELAHKVQPPGFIPDDAFTPHASEKNTQAVIEHCAQTINAQKP